MTKRISEEKKQLMQELYQKNCYSVREIARLANVSYSTAYSYTKIKERINPVTGKSFESLNQYQRYLARQKTDPVTRKPFESRVQYEEYLARKRSKRRKNRMFSNLIKRKLKERGESQSWLASEVGVPRQAVFLYTQGKILPRKSIFARLCSVLELPYKTLDDLLR